MQTTIFLVLLSLFEVGAHLRRGVQPAIDANGWPTDRNAALRRLHALQGSVEDGRLQLHDASESAIHGCFIVNMQCTSTDDETLAECHQTRDVLMSELELAAAADDGSSGMFTSEFSQIYNSSLNGFSGCFSPNALQTILANPEVEVVEEDLVVTADVTQVNPVWGLDRIDQELLSPDSSFDTGNVNGAGVDVFIIDTGVNTLHEEYSDRLRGGADFVNDGNGYEDCNGHGSHCAGTAVGNTYGVAKQADLYAVRVLDCQGSGSLSGVLAGLDWVVSKKQESGKPSIASMSLGAGYSSSLNSGVAAASAAGVVVVVAAGNENMDACNASPASEPSAITVGSTTDSDGRSSFSNFGTCVDIFAPGSSIKSAWIGGNDATTTISGTSMATPHVAGAVALELELMMREGATALHLHQHFGPETRRTQEQEQSVVEQVTSRLLGRATRDKLSDTQTDSPNLLLRTARATGPISTPAPAAPSPAPTPAPPTPPTSAPSLSPTEASMDLEMRITTKAWAYEVEWSIDGNAPTHDQYSDNSNYTHTVALTPGSHTITLRDTYGDGWHGGYWELVNAATGQRVAGCSRDGVSFACGGPSLGLVTGAGFDVTVETIPPTPGPTTAPTAPTTPTPAPTTAPTAPTTPTPGPTTAPTARTTPTPAPTTAPTAPTSPSPTPAPTLAPSTLPTSAPSLSPTAAPTATAQVDVEMRIVTKQSGSEVYWGIDTPKIAHVNPRQYGPYGNNQTYVHRFSVTPGESHLLKVMDSFGDGWDSGYWELIRTSSGERIAGGSTEGKVAGFGASVFFSV